MDVFIIKYILKIRIKIIELFNNNNNVKYNYFLNLQYMNKIKKPI